ncbi:MAG: S8 family serine peptidase [Chloroflexota bacterium]
MKQRLFVLFVATAVPLLLAALIFFYPTQTAVSARTNKYDPALQQALNQANDFVRVIFHLNEQTDLDKSTLPEEEVARRTAVIDQLQQTANTSQEPLRQKLQELAEIGVVEAYQPLWIINAIAVTLTPDTLAQIAQRADVAKISLDAAHHFFDPIDGVPQAVPQQAPPVTLPTWNVTHIGTPLVWEGLGVRGEGVVVAIMDSGVDWTHPILRANYRGHLPNGSVDHAGSWFSPGQPNISEPSDILGHGTHVAGIAVGQDGIGVAPDAEWIAVNISNAEGTIFSSFVHQGFEWLLAPSGDPALAPDVVNNSWAGGGATTIYRAAVDALEAAGIVMAFAAGNNGPLEGSVGAPASYPETLAVGASDELDLVAWFSSRGPSPQTGEPKPTLVAPGTAVYSAFRNNEFFVANGTSMATPHVAGTIALMLSANPQLPTKNIFSLLRNTVVPIAKTHPNNDSGWGRLDAYAAVSTQVTTGLLDGQILGDGLPLPHAGLTLTTPADVELQVRSDENGRFQLPLLAGEYEVETAVFGYESAEENGLTITIGTSTTVTLDLASLPTGTIEGQILDQSSGEPLTARIEVLDTPITVETDKNGRYAIDLPAGTYQLAAHAHAHALGKASQTVTADQTNSQDFFLAAAPAILLVDSGQWYYSSVTDYYAQGLFDINHTFDLHSIRNPNEDVPTLEQLEPYDIVIWSAPQDSVGRIGANDVITDYLGTGGNLLISGEDIAFYDGLGFGTQTWFFHRLEALYDGETTTATTVHGVANTPFASLDLTLNGEDSAENQHTPDQARLREGTLTKPIFSYDNGRYGGLMAGHCEPFQLVYLGFGLEGVDSAANRAELLQRSFDHFAAPLVTEGVNLTPDAIDDFAIPGEQLVYTFTVRNLSETLTDTFAISHADSLWPTSLLTETLTLGPCDAAETVLTIDVPPDVAKDEINEFVLTAVSPHSQQQTTIKHKTPGNFLLVDDERWFNNEDIFIDALAENGVTVDVWETGGSPAVRGAPSLDFLNQYEMVFWHTGYDWFAPVTATERKVIEGYLKENGRLFLNSQDYLYYNLKTPLTLDHFGIISQSESVTPTLAYGEPTLGLESALAGPLPLDYEKVLYQNFSDGLIIAPQSTPFFWHNQGTPAGTFNAGEGWRTAFLNIPLETLPNPAHPPLINSVIGWLSDWGDATFTVDQRIATSSEPRTYTITLNSFNAITQGVRLTNTLPAGLTILPDTLTGDAHYDAAQQQITWQGNVSETHLISYQAIPGPTAPPLLENRLTIVDERLNVQFDKMANLWLNELDLKIVDLSMRLDDSHEPYRLAYQLVVANEGETAVSEAAIQLRLPDHAYPITETLTSSHGIAELKKQRVRWTTDVAPQQMVTASIVLTYTPAVDLWLPVTAVVEDGITDPIIRHLQQYLPSYQHFLPFTPRDKPD